MKYKEGERVKSRTSGQVGTIIGTDYLFQVKYENTYEAIRYQIDWDVPNKNPSWVDEINLMLLSDELEVNPETEIDLLRIQIDKALDNRSKEDFHFYAKELNKLLGKVGKK